MVNSPLIRPYFLGGGGGIGVPLDSHDLMFFRWWSDIFTTHDWKKHMHMVRFPVVQKILPTKNSWCMYYTQKGGYDKPIISNSLYVWNLPWLMKLFWRISYSSVASCWCVRMEGSEWAIKQPLPLSRDKWYVYPLTYVWAPWFFSWCSTLGFLGIITHKYPLYRAYIGISHSGVRWVLGTSNELPWHSAFEGLFPLPAATQAPHWRFFHQIYHWRCQSRGLGRCW